MTSQRTALHERHQSHTARFVEFGGWEMPVRYGSIVGEHLAVRRAAGLFDLSHMGELRVTGPDAAAGLAGALIGDPRGMVVGRAAYSLLCTPEGGVIDDVIVYRLGDEEFLVVPNAANSEAVSGELAERMAGLDAVLADETLQTSLVAVQGPAAAAALAPLTGLDLGSLRNYAAAEATVAGIPALVARTGYTGEDGFELFTAWDDGAAIWAELLDSGDAAGIVPCGLGARDTLRLEAGMPLYGNELDRETTPYEAGLGWAVKLDHEFVGRAALAASLEEPLRKQLVGLVVKGRGIARHGYTVTRRGKKDPVGVITSGSQSPTLDEAIAMAYVPPGDAAVGTILDVAIREAAVAAEVVPLPFYRRPGR
jgi:aminomethyltransferase